jgi:Ni,Fe-hydrogenase I cytochrome b subunit
VAYDECVSGSDTAAWAATALFPSTAAAGFVLRRFVTGRFAIRLRPHFVLGYAVFGLALVHTALAMGAMHTLSATDLQLATLALAGLALQAFLGASLQAPGAYRTVLRRWHLATTWSVALFIAAHVLLTL